MKQSLIKERKVARNGSNAKLLEMFGLEWKGQAQLNYLSHLLFSYWQLLSS